MIDFAMKRPAVRCATDFGKTALGAAMMMPVGRLTVIRTLALGFFNSLQFSSMNSMAYADIDTNESSMASTIASSFQQISMSFGLAFGSLVAAWYLGDLPQSNRLAVITALHRAFMTLGGLTIVSALSFWTLRARDGESVSRAAPDLA
jgi:hypothetical protein